MRYNADSNFWELGDYANAHLSKLQLPQEVIEKIFSWWKGKRNMLVFLGNPGCGKSYLIAALIHELIDKRQTFRYFHEKDFYSQMRKTIEKNWDYEYEIKRLCETPFLFMDDLHSSVSTDFQKECLFNFIDQRSISEYPTIVTSNLFLDQMKSVYEERFISRLKNKKNTIIELNWIDKRQSELNEI